MANASVEKIKALGLRHGEKAVMGITAAVCLMFLYMAATRPAINTTPEAVREDRQPSGLEHQAKAGQRRYSQTSRIREYQESNFEKMVNEQASNKIDAVAFRLTSPWTSPEPGARPDS